MSNQIDVLALASAIKRKRGKQVLRSAANEIGDVSAATLSRVEQGKVPDLDTYVKLCRWLNVSPDEFVITYNQDANQNNNNETEHESTPQIVAAYLRADRTLDPNTADALVKMIELAYQAALRGEISRPE